jgi:hypothetical protein
VLNDIPAHKQTEITFENYEGGPGASRVKASRIAEVVFTLEAALLLGLEAVKRISAEI